MFATNIERSVNDVLISTKWYELEVTDPTELTQQGWAYVVYSSALEVDAGDDYVDFNETLHRVVSDKYRLGFGATHIGIEYLALGNSAVDLLDRGKIQVACDLPDIPDLPELCPLTEQTLPIAWPDILLRDGPVRVIYRGGRALAYESVLHWETTFFLPRGIGETILYSWDFSSVVSGSTLYNEAQPGGVVVDGVPDDMPARPTSNWWQLSSDRGTIVSVLDTSQAGGTQTNYYVDDRSVDLSDRGDRRHYGEVGIFVARPSRSFTYESMSYFLPANQPNVGQTYVGYVENPLSVDARLQTLDLPNSVYLPAVRR